MTISIIHTFVSAIEDDPADVTAGKVVPSEWNAEHTIDGLGSAAEADVGDFDAAGAAAAAQAASQPLDSDLTAIAALSTTPFGRALLESADAAALRTATGLGTLATQSGTFSGTSSGTNTGDQTNISGNAATVTTNANLTGDVTSSGNATTLATVNSNVGTFGSTTKAPVVTVNAKGLVTAVSEATISGAATPMTFNVRLTLESGVPVSSSDQTGKTNIYVTPYGGNFISLWDGSAWQTVTFTEQTLAVGTKTAFVPRDIFGYLNSGTLAVEDAVWLNATVTMTIASPGVITWTAHGMNNGDSVVLTTTGALPTGLTANTEYFVVNKATDTFQLSATQGGSAINTTGSQSGTHTGWQSRVRATAVVWTDGVQTKSGDKTRLFLGTYLTDSTTTTAKSAAKQYLWNRFNQQPSQMANATETTDSWPYTIATFRQARGSTTNQLDYVTGDASSMVEAQLSVGVSNTSAAVTVLTGIGVNSRTAATNTQGMEVVLSFGSASGNPSQVLNVPYRGRPGLGRNYLVWLEYSGATGTTTWYGDNGHTTQLGGITGTIWN